MWASCPWGGIHQTAGNRRAAACACSPTRRRYGLIEEKSNDDGIGSGSSVGGSVRDHDHGLIVQLHVLRAAGDLVAVHEHLKAVVPLVAVRPKAARREADAPHAEELAERELARLRRFEVHQPGVVVRVDRLDRSLRGIDADVRRDGLPGAVHEDLHVGVLVHGRAFGREAERGRTRGRLRCVRVPGRLGRELAGEGRGGRALILPVGEEEHTGRHDDGDPDDPRELAPALCPRDPAPDRLAFRTRELLLLGPRALRSARRPARRRGRALRPRLGRTLRPVRIRTPVGGDVLRARGARPLRRPGRCGRGSVPRAVLGLALLLRHRRSSASPAGQKAAPASGAWPLYGCCPNGGAVYDDVNPNAAARFTFAHFCSVCQATNAIWVPAGSVPAAPSSG